MHRACLILLTVSLITFATSASAQVAFVQATANSSAAVSSFSVSFSSNTTAGNLILIGFDFSSNTAFSSISDSQGNTFTQAGGQLTSPGGSSSRVYYANNIKGGADTITIKLSATSSFIETYLTEYTGVNQTVPVDVQAGSSGGAGSVSSGNATTTTAGDLIYGFCAADFTCTVGTGFTSRSTFNNNIVEDQIAGNAGTYAATGFANNGWTMQMVALKAASSSPSSSPLNACDLATPFGTVDGSDVQAAINMSLGVSPCTANVAGPNACNVVVVQRVIDAALSGTCTTTTSMHQVSLAWTASTTQNVTYNVYRSVTSGSYSTPLATLIGGTSYTDNSVTSGQTYYYVITAVSGGMESNHSNETTAVIPIP